MKESKMNITEEGIKRQRAHPQGTKRYYKDDKYREQTIGLAGEIALGK